MKIGIVGLGLIGGSFAKLIKAREAMQYTGVIPTAGFLSSHCWTEP